MPISEGNGGSNSVGTGEDAFGKGEGEEISLLSSTIDKQIEC